MPSWGYAPEVDLIGRKLSEELKCPIRRDPNEPRYLICKHEMKIDLEQMQKQQDYEFWRKEHANLLASRP